MGYLGLSSSSSTTTTTTALRWLGFVIAIWVQSISGNNYTFSNYFDALKYVINLTQLQLNNLSSYGTQWLVVSCQTQPLSYWQMCIFLCLGGNNMTWMNTTVLVTCIRNFRRNRGPVSGVLKGYVGLSTTIFTDVCTAFYCCCYRYRRKGKKDSEILEK